MPNELDKSHSELGVDRPLPRDAEKLSCAVAERCGGCPEFRLPAAAQRELKGKALMSGLETLGVAHQGSVSWLVANTTAYRNRIRLALQGGLPSYFNQAKDPQCAVLEPALLSVLSAFERWAPQHRAALSSYCLAEARIPDADQRAAVYLRHTQRNGLSIPPPDRSLLPEQFDGVVVAFEGGPLRLQRFLLTDAIHVQIPIGGFMQVNSSANRLMVEQVVAWAEYLNARRVLDLFAGSGNFSLPLAHAGRDVLAVESDLAACQALLTASTEQGIICVTIANGDASHLSSELATNGEMYDMVIADPPRGGLRGKVGALCAMTKAAIVLVSCDAGKFCLDARALCDGGFELSDCVAVDMFPHTRHMEVLGLFTPRGYTR